MSPDRREGDLPVSPLALAYAGRVFRELGNSFHNVSSDPANSNALQLTSQQKEAFILDWAVRLDKIMQNPKATRINEAISREGLYRVSAALVTNIKGVRTSSLSARVEGEEVADGMLQNATSSPIHAAISLIGAAKQMAKEIGVNPQDIFNNEDLYSEFIRRITNPQAVADRHIRTADMFTFERIMIGKINQIVAKIIGEKEFPEEFLAIVKKIVKQTVWTDLELIEEAKTSVFQMRTTHIARAKREILRFWGEEGLKQLSEETRSLFETYLS